MSGSGAARPETAAGARTGAYTVVQALAVFSCAWSFLLLSAGGVVTSREAGLAVPDWPLSYGFVNPPGWTETPNVFEEHGHRLLGWILGIQIIALALLLQRLDPRPWMRRLGWIVLGAVILQGVMGGLRVVMLWHWMAVVHGSTGQAFFCLMVATALFTFPSWREERAPEPRAGVRVLRRRALLALAALFLQVVVGALIRHSRAGHDLRFVLPHIVWGLVAAVFALRAATAAWVGHGDRPALARPATLLAAGVLFQILLGLGTYFANVHGAREIVRPTYQWVTASAHQAAGAVVLAAALVLWLRARRCFAEAAAEGSATVPAGAAS